MSESIIQHESLPKMFWMFDIIVVWTDSNTSSVSVSLIIVSTYEFE